MITSRHFVPIAALLNVSLLLAACSDTAAPSNVPFGRHVVHGRVVGGMGTPLRAVRLLLESPGARWSTVSGEHGLFRFEGVSGGAGMLTATLGDDTSRMLVDMARTPLIGHSVRLPIWQLAWSDEFDGTTLDTSKWTAWNAPSELADVGWYRPEQLSVADGMLRIRSDAAPAGDRWHPTGAVVSRYEQRFGRYEVRARLPHGQGIWPAHWLVNADSLEPYFEIDIMELLGDDPRTVHFHNHWKSSTGYTVDAGTSYTAPVDFASDFHTFRVDWYVGTIVWYVDGVERWRTTTGVPDRAAILRLNTQVGGSWAGPPDATTNFPQFHDIDYVRISTLLR